MNRLQEKYKNVVVPQMMKDFEYKSVMEEYFNPQKNKEQLKEFFCKI